ncbi:MAG: polyphosphate polymerase domain-containing protein [Anaerolineales bacterium]|nr:MAG: polyphosphate polymerase domain-containing protein [Anaerolineales bacterium]
MQSRGLVGRYERKFFLEGFEPAQARSLVLHHPAMFYEVYPPRFINNIYFDTPWMEHYDDNISGSAARGKVRLRWYHELVGDIAEPILEFKIKRGWVGWKESYPFPAFSFDTALSAKTIQHILAKSQLPAQVVERLRGYQVSLVNRYYREYYATKDGRFRLTLDTDLTYYRVGRLSNPLFARSIDHGVVVVELKYDAEHEPQVQRVASHFPFRMTRSSKYVRGVEFFL